MWKENAGCIEARPGAAISSLFCCCFAADGSNELQSDRPCTAPEDPRVTCAACGCWVCRSFCSYRRSHWKNKKLHGFMILKNVWNKWQSSFCHPAFNFANCKDYDADRLPSSPEMFLYGMWDSGGFLGRWRCSKWSSRLYRCVDLQVGASIS